MCGVEIPLNRLHFYYRIYSLEKLSKMYKFFPFFNPNKSLNVRHFIGFVNNNI